MHSKRTPCGMYPRVLPERDHEQFTAIHLHGSNVNTARGAPARALFRKRIVRWGCTPAVLPGKQQKFMKGAEYPRRYRNMFSIGAFDSPLTIGFRLIDERGCVPGSPLFWEEDMECDALAHTTPVRCGCGGEAKTENYDANCGLGKPRYVYDVYCEECMMSTAPYTTEAEAITAWNRAMSGVVVAKNATTDRTAKAEYSNADGEYLCNECGRVVQIEDVYCCGCGAKLDWGDEDIPMEYFESGGR